MRKSIKISTIVMLIFCLCIIGNMQSVYAGSSTKGTAKSVTVLGQKYSYYSSLWIDDEGYMSAVTDAGTADWAQKPIGYIGMLARIYKSSGELRTSSDWKYNSIACCWDMTRSNYIKDKGTYYSKGQVKFYNGNGYNTYTCNSSPNMQLRSGVTTQFPVNENGLTYGSDFYSTSASDSPDLILAEGKNGNVGYVKYLDLNKCEDIGSIEEAINYQKSLEEEREIPVYDKSGETVIDSFVITNEK